MAKATLHGTANSVLRQLNDPALQEFLLVCDSDKDLERLEQTIRTITGFLDDAEQRESKEHLVKGWLFRLRAVLYDADDLLDSIAYTALHEKANAGNTSINEVTLLCSKSNPHVGSMAKTALEVKAIKERLYGVEEAMGRFSFTTKPTEVEEEHVSLQEVLARYDVDKAKVMQVLRASYDDLTSALKLCFAYCSIFPKDYEFDKDELVRLWIAQGYIVPSGRKSLEEVGNDYFFHMVDRCFFPEVKMSPYDGHVRYTCRMHGLLHDLAIQVAGDECCRFAERDREIMDERTAHRHISLNYNPSYLLLENSQSKTLRTLLFLDETNLDVERLDSFFSRLTLLRALHLSKLGLKMLPDSIGGLIHLRYVNLSGNSELMYLPNSVCKLYHLQTLILQGCRKLKELPMDLGKLVNLRHLILEHCDALDTFPSGLEALTTLVTLDQLKVHRRYGGLRYMGHLDNLCGTLSIKLPTRGWPNCIEDARKSSMFRKEKLNGISLCWEWARSDMEVEDVTKVMLEQLRPNENLQYLKIEQYGDDTLSDWFCSLSNLRVLVLEQCFLEYLDVNCVRSGSSLFPCLEVLRMKGMHNLKGWWRRELGDNDPVSINLPCLHRVSEINIEYCPYLMKNMPLFGEEVQKIRLNDVNERLVSKLLGTMDTRRSSTSEWRHYTKLQVLELQDIPYLKCLPEGWLRHLATLKSLKIDGCRELTRVSSCGLAYLTSLEELVISFDRVVRLEDQDGEKPVEIMPWTTLHRLRKLEVPWQSHLQEGLQYLTSLRELKIWYYDASQVEADNENMEHRGLLWKLGSTRRLRLLDISFGEIRCNFPKWIQYLPLVEELTLEDCEELMGMSWRIVANMNLQKLVLSRIRKVSSVDDWVGEQQTQCSSLTQLYIYGNIDQDEQQWIHGDIPWKLLQSLRTLGFYFIRNMRGKPEGIEQHLTSLQNLCFMDCYGIDGVPRMDDQSHFPLVAQNYNWLPKMRSEVRAQSWHGY